MSLNRVDCMQTKLDHHFFIKISKILIFIFLSGCSFNQEIEHKEQIKKTKKNEPKLVRSEFKTNLVDPQKGDQRLPSAPSDIFKKIKYKTKIGYMKAIVSKPKDYKKRYPAIIWLSGGFPVGGFDESMWRPVDPSNDQSAKIYREKGIIMMYPTLRGTFGNPGYQENFLGEVDDVISAIQYLKSLSFVDPNRIYLGGHSTGGTLALLVASATNDLCTTFSFGPVANPAWYGPEAILYNSENINEMLIRSPAYHIGDVKSNLMIIEGAQDGNADSVHLLKSLSKGLPVKAIVLDDYDHFSVLSPANEIIADKILKADDCRI